MTNYIISESATYWRKVCNTPSEALKSIRRYLVPLFGKLENNLIIFVSIFISDRMLGMQNHVCVFANLLTKQKIPFHKT